MLYFLHIPKTAGTSLSGALRRSFDETSQRIIGPCLLDHLLLPENLDFSNADLLMGHLALLPMQSCPSLEAISILRHPVSHLMSWYQHVRREPGHYFHRVVNAEAIDFSTWLRDERFASLVDNPQARNLAFIPDITGRHFSEDDPTRIQREFELQIRCVDDPELVRMATKTVDSLRAVGVVERIDVFLTDLRMKGIIRDESISFDNAGSYETKDLPSEDYKYIEAKCPADFLLYYYVRGKIF